MDVGGAAGSPARAIAVAVVALYSLDRVALSLDSIERIGVVQSALIGALLGISGGVAARETRARLGLAGGWARAARGARGRRDARPTARGSWQASGSPSEAVGIFLASHSSFDTGAEWVIALGCVLTLYRTIQQELTQTNVDLLAAKEVLQELVDRDSADRPLQPPRAAGVLRESFPTGATIFFFDLNDFKIINDSYGHQAGDECLSAFASALQASFRPRIT